MYKKTIIFISFIISNWSAAFASELISLFPMKSYSQEISNWLKPSDSDYDKPLIGKDQQTKRLTDFYNHYFAGSPKSTSPWDVAYVSKILTMTGSDSLFALENKLIAKFTNPQFGMSDKSSVDRHDVGRSNDIISTNNRSICTNTASIGYSHNFLPYGQAWIDNIAKNMDISRLSKIKYDKKNLAIAINNTHARALPTQDVYFYSHQLAGEGYPFDNLQQSALWVGTPMYIVMDTVDHAWSLVITPDFIDWVKSEDIAKVDNKFISTWQSAAKNKMIAIVNETSISDKEGNYKFNTYVGTIFPAKSTTEILIPVADAKKNATIQTAIVSITNSVVMPYQLTPHNLANVMENLIGRPYGWGNMNFYNDCSAELKALYAPFAIYLPRNTSEQIKAGKMTDLSDKSSLERESILIKDGRKLVTLVRIPGHILMYLGAYSHFALGSKLKDKVAISYQNIWGLRPLDNSYRAIIGKSVIFPLLESYPENHELVSFYDKDTRGIFQLIYLDEMPTIPNHAIDLKSMIFP
jgi:cell wall-associated NlpC family hydrolase